MAAPTQSGSNAVSQDTLITIKVSVNDSLKKLKLPLRDLGANVLPDKLRHLLAIKPEQTVVFERFSDSAGGYIVLDPNNPQVFKTLVRAAKAKLKLRLKATVTPMAEKPQEQSAPAPAAATPTHQLSKEPLIVSSPLKATPRSSASLRTSAALDGRTVGKGIFQFKDGRATQHPALIDTSEAPVPRPFAAPSATNLKTLNVFDKEMRMDFPIRSKEKLPAVEVPGHAWSVYCNQCDRAVTNEHFHCSICDGGDYDLCPQCVTDGHLCPGEGHWLIKRFVKDGTVINSTTERIQPRKAKAEKVEIKKEEPEIKKEIPGAFTDDIKTLAEVPHFATRTCNSCVVVLPEAEFVACESCEDFDLCLKCNLANKHGHHPGHGFKPATKDTLVSMMGVAVLPPGRNARHNAICDGCDQKIYGVRHKCLDCPDWDYCNDCVKSASRKHPRHRFTAIYSPIADAQPVTTRHAGIFCDGPLCRSRGGEQTYITGVRYKCAVCHDTDFCASCEALPTNSHNRTHPLIKFKTPVRGVSISTENEDVDGTVRTMGDRRLSPAAAVSQIGKVLENAESPKGISIVRTMADIKPTEEKKTSPVPGLSSEAAAAQIGKILANAELPKGITVMPHEEKKAATMQRSFPGSELNSQFVKDTVSDGTVVAPNQVFTQIFTMRNNGSIAWPAGCAVKHIGGDNMLNIDNNRPTSASALQLATESNVIGRDVAVGEEVAFKITLKAPVREGKAISYWRTKSPEGTPFGHRLWVDIAVKKPAAAPQQMRTSFPPAIVNSQQQDTLYAQQQQQREQLLRQRQQMMMAQMAAQQRANQAQASRAAIQQTVPQGPPPPAYDALPNGAHISARIAAMREQQSKRREQLMAQFNANRDAPQAQGINRSDMPSWNQHANPSIGPAADYSYQMSEEDKARKEAARARVEHIKAKILRAREEKAKMVEAKKKTAAEEAEKVNKILEEVVKANEAEKEAEAKKLESLEGSQMVFPKLDKESPASSTYQSITSNAGSSKGKAAYVENEDGEVERSAEPAMESPKEEKEEFDELDDFDDIEVLSADGEESASEDDGFLTDEEYDILDASDHETVASP